MRESHMQASSTALSAIAFAATLAMGSGARAGYDRKNLGHHCGRANHDADHGIDGHHDLDGHVGRHQQPGRDGRRRAGDLRHCRVYGRNDGFLANEP